MWRRIAEALAHARLVLRVGRVWARAIKRAMEAYRAARTAGREAADAVRRASQRLDRVRETLRRTREELEAARQAGDELRVAQLEERLRRLTELEAHALRQFDQAAERARAAAIAEEEAKRRLADAQNQVGTPSDH